MLTTWILLAQEKSADPTAGLIQFAPLFVMIILFYFLFLHPMQKRQEQEKNALLSSLVKNDKVITTAGIKGTVVSVSDTEDEVVVKVDDNVRLKMLKASILKNLSHEERMKAEQEKAREAKKGSATGPDLEWLLNKQAPEGRRGHISGKA